jgi:hypothetical protein
MFHRDYPFAVTSSAKAIKALDYGYRNAIHYLIPAGKFGMVNLCPDKTDACAFLCLGTESGQASMRKGNRRNSVIRSRIDKTKRFMFNRAAYFADLCRQIERQRKLAKRDAMQVCVRLNGCSDIAFEGIRFAIVRDNDGRIAEIVMAANALVRGLVAMNIFDHYPDLPFVDYTKSIRRFNRTLPANYHLTLSRSDLNETECLEALARGINVAVCFAGNKPATWRGFDVIDGDQHDLRQLDPRGERGVVVGLSPKGRKAKRDQSGFVVR